MSLDQITHCKIYPGIGIARLGNSPDEFFIGPEAPGHAPKPEGGFKDSHRRVKRQAARFRIYAYDSTGKVVQELTAADADITWTVHLTNKKASWHEFHGRYYPQRHPDHPVPPLRNLDVTNRHALIIDPGERSITVGNNEGQLFDTGKFFEINVPLGELRTDEAGRLLVLGGYGHSGTTKENNPIHHYANNNYWFDDASDGPVTATVKLKGSTLAIPVTGAWVIVAPPKFTPEHTNLVSFYDVAQEMAIAQQWLPAPDEVSFTRDIYPILARISNYPWVSKIAQRGHSSGRRGHFLDPQMLSTLADNSEAAKPARQTIFSRIRKPVPCLDINNPPAEAVEQANYFYMPQLSGDDGDVEENQPAKWFTVLASQYEKLQKWANGQFTADWKGTPPVPPVFTDIPLQDQPAALERAALEPCVGGPFYPGIEITFIAIDKDTYSEAFRLAARFQPGDITEYMAVPWQADFYECNTDWWPAQRPDDVVPQSEYHKLLETRNPNNQQQDTVAQLLTARKSWARGLGEQIDVELPSPGDNDMIEKWSGLGFVVTQQAPTGETIFVETERTPYLGLNHREYFYKLMNIQSHPDFIPRARSLATEFLKQAWDLQKHPDFPGTLLFFPYSKEAFEARMTTIYKDLVDQTEAYNPIDDPVFKTRADLLQRIYQFAPFNLLDGAWLRNTTQAGPINKIHALLFAIWMDEVGDGQVELNHCNLYNDLLHSVGIYLEPVNSHDFAYNPNMLDSAYTVPLFELAISQWAQDFFPEILGMTFQLEWEVVSLKPTIKLFDYFGISSHFYSMHVGIDNATEGHGAKAKEAIEEYLDQVFEEGGEEAVQKQWQRIWNGYIAFSQTGTLGNDLANLIAKPLTLDDQVTEMMLRKKPYAQLNHGDKKLGANYINDWFEDTEGFKQELLASGLMIPGDPDNNPFFNLLSFTGPMYKVFTDDEVKLWRDWIRSQGAKPTPPSPIDPATAMVDLIDTLRHRQAGTVGHQDHVLIGPDPNNPDAQITRPVAWWFTQKSTDLMRTVANEENGLIDKGNPENSPFVTQLLSPANAMGQAFTGVIPNTGGETGRDIAIKWITAGCPIPGEPSATKPRLTLASFAIAASQQDGRVKDLSGQAGGISSLLPGKLFGMGTVH